MTQDQAKRLAPIITAFAEGKKIQIKCCDGKYYDTDTLNETEDLTKYRIKPRMITIERWAACYEDGRCFCVYTQEEDARDAADRYAKGFLQVVRLSGTINADQ